MVMAITATLFFLIKKFKNELLSHINDVVCLANSREELSKFVESHGALSPGAQALTTILSKPFVRLDKYPSLLKELERHVEVSKKRMDYENKLSLSTLFWYTTALLCANNFK